MVVAMSDVTSGKAWRSAREEGIPIRFPSGNVARIRPMETDFFVLHGKIPDDLSESVIKMMNGSPERPDIPVDKILDTMKDQWVPFLNQLCTYAFVNPKVVSDPQGDDEISVDDIAYTDKLVVYRLFSLPAQTLRKFREKQVGDVASVEPQSNDVPESQPDDEHQSVGEPTNGNARLLDGASIR